MEPIRFRCTQCQAGLKAPPNLAGKKLKCPKCGQLVAIPAAAAGPSESLPMAELAEKPALHSPAPPAMKRCPYCQETIVAAALKCRHCGEFLQPGGAPKRRRVAARARRMKMKTK